MEEPVAIKPISGYDEEIETKYETPKVLREKFLTALLKHGKRIIDGNKTTNGTEILYTVPEGKIFYLFSASISAESSNLGKTESWISLGIPDEQMLPATCFGAGQAQNSLSLPFPVAFTEGEQIKAYSENADISVITSIIGYEIDRLLAENFI